MTAIQELALEIAEIKRQLRGLKKPRLTFSSIENGAIKEYNSAGDQVAAYGRQFDGGHGAVVLIDPVPPATTAPIAAAAVGGAKVRWDGAFVDGAGTIDLSIVAPTYFSRVEVHASTDPDFTAEFADTLKQTIETPRGGEVMVSLPVGTHYIRFVARSRSGKASAASAVTTVQVVPLQAGDIEITTIDAEQTDILNGDHINMVDGRTLAEQITEAAAPSPIADTGWVDCTLGVDGVQEGTSLPQVRMLHNREVTMSWGVSGTGMAPNSSYDVATVPATYVPPGTVPKKFQIAGSSPDSSALLLIQPSGAVNLQTGAVVATSYMFDAAHWFTD